MDGPRERTKLTFACLLLSRTDKAQSEDQKVKRVEEILAKDGK